MAKVVYLGPSTIRELSSDDFSNLGVESVPRAFPRDSIVEVEDAVAEVLTTDPRLAGEFGTVTVEVPSSDASDASDQGDTDKKPKERARASK